MLQRLKIKYQRSWITFMHSMPIRLLFIQISDHPFLVLMWVFIFAILTGVGENFGFQYLLLEPEYGGEVNFWSLFILGISLGALNFAYMIYLYINLSYRFHFLVFRRNPFLTFILNNSLLPLIFFATYTYQFLRLQNQFHHNTHSEILTRGLGLVLGVMSVFFVLSLLFFTTNKNIFQVFGENIQREIQARQQQRAKKTLLGKVKESMRSSYDVDHFFSLQPFGFIRNEHHGLVSRERIVKVLNQNHGNLLLLMMIVLVIIVTLSFFDDNPTLQIPAGASALLALTLVVLIVGALSFWVQRFGGMAFFILFGLLYAYQKWDFLSERNMAFGMNYQTCEVEYTQKRIDELANDKQAYEKDRGEALLMLEKWKENWQAKYGKDKKPQAVFVCVSGGGLRSAMWTLQSLQHIDSISGAKFGDEIRLISGASGGMLGATYFRELLYDRKQKRIDNLYDEKYVNNIGLDLLNRPIFRACTDALLPNLSFKIGCKTYDSERGWVFDKQLESNVPQFKNKRIGDYKYLEANAEVPPIIFSPVIINQGKVLFISPNGASFLTHSYEVADSFYTKQYGIEFRRFFAGNEPDSLRLSTALRMNATFPYVLPSISLPSKPAMRVIDAGAMDNYGISTAIKYLYEFKDWFAENTDQVVLVTIRAFDREDSIDDLSDQTLIGQAMTPFNGGASAMAEMKDFANDYLLKGVRDWYGGRFRLMSVEYPYHEVKDPVSMSFHLTSFEKEEVKSSLFSRHNMTIFKQIEEIYGKE